MILKKNKEGKKKKKRFEKPLETKSGSRKESDETIGEEMSETTTPETGGPSKEEGEKAEKTEEKEIPVAEVLSVEEQLSLAQDKYLRAIAELNNYKRRSAKEKSEISDYVKVAVFRDIIPVLDDFKRFFDHVEQDYSSLDHSFVEGVEMIRNSLVKALEKHKVQPVDQAGVPVDYNLHEAVTTQPVEEKEKDGTVMQVLEKGYRIGDQGLLIRPAKVAVGILSEE